MTYYELLQVSSTASFDVISAAYRTLARMYHPDNLETGDADMMRRLNDAHDVLKDPTKRHRYDLEAAQNRAAQERSGVNDWQNHQAPWPQTQAAYPNAYPPSVVEIAHEAAFRLGMGLADHLMSSYPGLDTLFAEIAARRKGVRR